MTQHGLYIYIHGSGYTGLRERIQFYSLCLLLIVTSLLFCSPVDNLSSQLYIIFAVYKFLYFAFHFTFLRSAVPF